MGSTLILEFLYTNVLNYRYFHIDCSTFLKIKQESSSKRTNQHVSYAFTSSPLSFHARHILPTSKFQHNYSWILLIFYTTDISEQHVWELWLVWIQFTGLTLPLQRNPVNNPITLISPVQWRATFFAAGSLCVALQISEQFSLKARMPTHWMLSWNQILTQNDHSRSFKVIRFGVNKESLRGYIVQYNNCSLECEGSEDIAGKVSENRHFRRPHSHWSPLASKPLRISA